MRFEISRLTFTSSPTLFLSPLQPLTTVAALARPLPPATIKAAVAACASGRAPSTSTILLTVMATEKQINANRQNARKSTGPQSPEGRAAVRGNALHHRLTAKSNVLSTEKETDQESGREARTEKVGRPDPDDP